MAARLKFADLRPYNKEQEIRILSAVRRVMLSGQYIGGKEVESFEREWAHYVGARFCVGVASGFHALKLILRTLYLPPMARVLIPANTCAPTFAAADDAGSYDVQSFDILNWPVAEESDEFRIQQANPVIFVRVHLYGYLSTCHPDVPYIIDDACQAHGSYYRENDCQDYAHATAWSFYPTKNLGAMGDAGAVTTNIPSVAQSVHRLRDYRVRDGINARLDPVQAAILRAKLPDLDRMNSVRAAQAALYNRRLRTLFNSPIFPAIPDLRNIVRDTNWHQYVIWCRAGERDDLQRFLKTRGIPTLIHYPEPGSAHIGQHPPNALRASESVLSLPLGIHLSVIDARRIADTVIEFYEMKNRE